MSKGIVYVFTNQSMPGYIKIGVTTSSVAERLQSLDTANVPLPFSCYFAMEVSNCKGVEKLIHQTFDSSRVRPNREFFTVSPESVVAALKLTGGTEIMGSNAPIDENGRPMQLSCENLDSFDFDSLKIPVGAELTFTRDDGKKCRVVSPLSVEYDGEEFSVAELSLKLLQEIGYNWNSCCGFDFWEFEGEQLRERYVRLREAKDMLKSKNEQ
ncbi:MAG: GIY-YIG nuclease family protein [Puniceicoccales bacterium]|jgi:hypothetical protein|nr:GIY-YIG nuclease family protein [Puniceicoccales bacterium]